MDWVQAFAIAAPDIAALRAEVAAVQNSAALDVRFPGLPRRVGRSCAPAGEVRLQHGSADRGRWRLCDVAALMLIEKCGGAAKAQALYDHGDRDERLMAARALLHLADAAMLRSFLSMLQTSNDQALFEAGFIDAAHPAALLDDAAWNRFLLKAAFIGLPLERIYGWEARANATLVQMLLDLKAERMAAGRDVWAGTERVVAAVR